MKMEGFQAVKDELQQLDAELKKFKEEFLAARIRELEQIIHAFPRRAHPGVSATSISTDKLGRESKVLNPIPQLTSIKILAISGVEQ